MRKKYLKWVIEGIFILVVTLWMVNVLKTGLNLPIRDPDEAAWIYSGYYFNLYFSKLGFFHEDWSDRDALDHPPLVKYIVGGVLFLKGHGFDSLEAKRLWFSIPVKEFWVRPEVWMSKIPPHVLPSIRLVIFAFAFLQIFLLYFFVRKFYGLLPAVVTTSLWVANPLFTTFSTIILADPVLVFFFILFVIVCEFYIRSGKGGYIILASILCSLAFLTKENGLILVFAWVTVVVLRNGLILSHYPFKFLLVGLVIFLFMTLILNPVFINSGIEGIRLMYEYRLSYLRFIQETFKPLALLSLKARMMKSTEVLFFQFSPAHQLIGIPLEGFMFLLGVYYSFRKRDVVLVMVFVFFVAVPISFLLVNAFRYYYIIFPFVYLLAGVSLNVFKELLIRRDGAKGNIGQEEGVSGFERVMPFQTPKGPQVDRQRIEVAHVRSEP